jgi:rhodanese-related sulfurtransferase
MKIGRYQLENLVREGVRFIFADLRSAEERALFTDPLLAAAMPLELAALKANLTTSHVPFDSPILLLSEDGTAASSAALELEAEGFKNVYIVRDGISGLRT